MGHRNIEIKQMKDSNSRQLTLWKRRTGLFKKANELATLCTAQIAIVIFCPGGKPFSFGHPSVDYVAQLEAYKYVDACQKTKAERLGQQLTEFLKQLYVEKRKGEILDRVLKANELLKNNKFIDNLSVDELLEMKTLLEKLRESLRRRMKELEASSLLSFQKQATEEDDK